MTTVEADAHCGSPPPPRARADLWFVLVAIGAAAAGILVLSTLAYTHMAPAMRRHPTPLASAPSGYTWLQAFSWWDGAWYAGIARHGYTFTLGRRSQSPVVFFPAYPLLVRAFTPLAGSEVLAGFLISLGSGLGASVLFFRWCADRLGRASAKVALGCLLLYPCSFYLFGVLYADALILVLALGAFLLLEREHPVQAGLVAALATATRPIGVVLIAALWVRALERRGAFGGGRRFSWSVLERRDAGLLAAPIGLAAYSAFLAIRFGHPLLFLEAERGWHQGPGWRTWLKVAWFHDMLRSPYLDPPHFHLIGHLLISVVALALAVMVFRRFGIGYGLYAVGVVGVSALSTRDFVGVGRYALAAFPCFAVAGDMLSGRPRLRWTVLGTSAVLLALLTELHARNMLIS